MIITLQLFTQLLLNNTNKKFHSKKHVGNIQIKDAHMSVCAHYNLEQQSQDLSFSYNFK